MSFKSLAAQDKCSTKGGWIIKPLVLVTAKKAVSFDTCIRYNATDGWLCKGCIG